MRLHAFVAMPFGTKEGIDCNRIYAEYIKPALERAGFEAFRADEEIRAGDIRRDMFQELLVADLVVVDLTLDNPNVWYELGVRHALRARGVILIQSQRGYQPFDIYTERKLRYHLKEGAPDPDFLDSDQAALAAMASATMAAWHGHCVSPVFALLHELHEQDWRSMLLAEKSEFSERYEHWQQQMETARRKNRAGIILVLAEETPTQALRIEATKHAGNSLLKLNQHAFALEQFQAALAIDPNDLNARQKVCICLGRMGRHEEARQQVKDILDDHPTNAESWALMGRIEKDAWIARWLQPDRPPDELRELAADEDYALLDAISPYLHAFSLDPSHYYSGINAVVLQHLRQHLGADIEDPAALQNLEGGVRWACLSALVRDPKDYWARVSLAELDLLLKPQEEVVRAYKAAVAAADKNWFALDSSQQTLVLLRHLSFRPEAVSAALAVFDKEIARLTPPWSPRHVILFSGHMIDMPDRPNPRFPAEQEATAAHAIQELLDRLDLGPQDLALTQGACGGDILFAEACLERNIKLELRLPFDEPTFLEKSVNIAGESWRERFYRIKAGATKTYTAPLELGPAPKNANPYERCNLWLLYTALAWGPDNVKVICLWDGKSGDGRGGTRHLYEEVKQRTGQVYWLNTSKLW